MTAPPHDHPWRIQIDPHECRLCGKIINHTNLSLCDRCLTLFWRRHFDYVELRRIEVESLDMWVDCHNMIDKTELRSLQMDIDY